ncbi:cytochrome c oxidase subunit 3 [Mesorhizobium sp. BR1-1-9]|uniref:cytochrome c oxidase subunit 3 n=1 Tax=unclassified Mesorhizobium TaxID=325217 RepID=UPI001CD178E4|nr:MULTISPECIES: cytochrome c oxidase subunit 3 [unclassified Mesorhizobium]MBZ9872862.1 cytochrome c oxidase subunit 3 [Mesorhizobium sp. BR1-1-9]MBZ9944865.1 cytochrome c oxidase subunit 3 [Mesorhizobium sp. BR1-1-13]
MSGPTESIAFDTRAREKAADAFGMWIFIGSEAMLFGAIVLVFLFARLSYGAAFAAASQHLSLPLGTLNTAVLITSSFAMALAHMFTAARRWRPAFWALMSTSLLGCIFLVIKAVEYGKEFREGLAPVLGAPFRFAGPDPAHAEFFFALYFAMTSLHALHLIGGIAVIAGILLLWPGTAQGSRARRVQAIGLYWHFVDIVWVFLFPVLYLINRA